MSVLGFDDTGDYNDDQQDSTSDLGFEMANTRRKRRLFVPYDDAAASFTPETAKTEEYQKYLESAPQRPKDSFWSNLAAGLTGGAAGFASHNVGQGIKVAKDIQDSPYTEAVEQWKLKGHGLEELSNIEQRRNTGKLAQLKAENDFQKNVNELMMKADEAERKTKDTEADNIRADKLAAGTLGNFTDLQANRKREREQKDKALGLEQENVNLHKLDTSNRASAIAAAAERASKGGNKVVSPASKAKALNTAHSMLKEQNPQVAALMEADDKTLTPAQRQAKKTFITVRQHLAQKLIDSNQLPDAEEIDMPEEKSGGSWFDRLFGNHSSESPEE